MRRNRHLWILLAVLGSGPTVAVELRAPLTTLMPCTEPLPAVVSGVTAEVSIPVGVTLGVGGYAIDAQGSWFQTEAKTLLTTGRQQVWIPFQPTTMHAPGHHGRWRPDASLRQVGLFFWSTGVGLPPLVCDHLRALPGPPPAPEVRIRDLVPGPDQVPQGQTWLLHWQADPATESLAVSCTAPDGTQRTLFPYLRQPMVLDDHRHHPVGRPAGRERYEIRLAPDQPGRWQVHLGPINLAFEATTGIGPVPRAVAPLGQASPTLALGLHFPVLLQPGCAPAQVLATLLDQVRQQAAATGKAVPVWLNAIGSGPGRSDAAALARAEQLLQGLAEAGLSIEAVLAAPSLPHQDPAFLELLRQLLGRWSKAPAVAGWRIQSGAPIPWAQLSAIQVFQARLETLGREAGVTLRFRWYARTTSDQVRAVDFTGLDISQGLEPGRTIELRTPLATAIPIETPSPRSVRPGRGSNELNTTSASQRELEGVTAIVAVLDIPTDAPEDLGVGAWLTTRHGNWYQTVRATPLPPGRHRVVFRLAEPPPIAVSDLSLWQAGTLAICNRAGIHCWSASGRPVKIGLVSAELVKDPAPTSTSPLRLTDLHLEACDPANRTCQGRTGQRWQMHFRIRPESANPYDPESTAAELVVTRPDGAVDRLLAFWNEPQVLSDRGDTETGTTCEPGRYSIRYRPRLGGTHRLRLNLRRGQDTLSSDLPDLIVAGGTWDDYVRVDTQDPRFLSTGRATGSSTFVWPIGLNLRSPNDLVASRVNRTRLTPDRGFHSFQAYLQRLSAAGGTMTEIWLSSWCLGLEWTPIMPGYYGIDRYNQIHAARLDQILNEAWRLGIRVALVIDNHTKWSNSRHEGEWSANPWSSLNGGPIKELSQISGNEHFLRGQERLRRYLIARYADDPAILDWKLWSEVDLSPLKGAPCAPWHAAAAKRWQELDCYDHPISSHWCGTYRHPDPAVCALPGIDLICIDAYQRPAKDSSRNLADLLWEGTHAANHLALFNKPVVVSEYGGNAGSCPLPQLAAEHVYGGWAALVSGYATAPMLWWYEFVDQGDRWQPYAALSRYLAGEDLRSRDGTSLALPAQTANGSLWSGAWMQPGRILGYVLDRNWAWNGLAASRLSEVRMTIGLQVKPGPLTVEWWDADTGRPCGRRDFDHAGGMLELTAPAFERHLAFKLLRR